MLTRIAEGISGFPYAFIAGAVISTTCAVFGVLVILRRVVFIGITLAEIAACGVALALVCHWPPFLGAALCTLAAAVYLAQPVREDRVPRDAVLGVLFVASAALSILLVARSGFGLHRVKSLLYGDLILTTRHDFLVLMAMLLPALCLLLVFLRPILHCMTDAEYARVLGLKVRLWDTLFFVSLSLAVSAASKTAGSLLVFAYLVVLPAASLMLCRRTATALVTAAAMSLAVTILGLVMSYMSDLPTNPTIIAALSAVAAAIALLVFVGRVVQSGRRRGLRSVQTSRS